MKKFIVYLLVIVMAVSLGFAVFYLVRDDEVISISSASMYKDVDETFTIDVNHRNKKSYTEISISSSNDEIVAYNQESNNFVAKTGGVARINFRTTNSNFRNLWCDVIVGDGTIESPFYISNAEQLAAIGMGSEILDVNGNGTGVYQGSSPYEKYRSDLCYKLVANIDASLVNDGYWVPLRRFSGRFDGNGLTIKNINIDKESYTEHFENAQDYNPNLFVTDNVGMFQEIAYTGMVYNFKLESYNACGVYDNFGTIAAVNRGVVERIEIKDAFLSVETDIFGGLVAKNISSESGENTTYQRHIARIDRCSIYMTMGLRYVPDANDQIVTAVIGNIGTIGGLVGLNQGGTIVYSYVEGDMYFGDDTTDTITYGGLVASNECISLTNIGGQYTSVYQGANIKDCYSNLNTSLMKTPNVDSLFAGVIATNQDYQNGLYDEDPNKPIVNNYIIGNYYNNENLNKEQENITKDFSGISVFKMDTTLVPFIEQPSIVKGLTTEELKVSENFISHYSNEIKFDENGNSLNEVITSTNLWLFDSVWAIDADTNNGMPYLNYQLEYIPDDFITAGVPIVLSLNTYTFENTIDFPITIVSGSNGKITIEVAESYTLKVSPAGQDLNWFSSDDTIVAVDSTGKITGKNVGTALITAKTKAGSTASITVIVESDESYVITNYPNIIPVQVGDQYVISGVNVVPQTTLTYLIQNPTIASVSVDGTVTGLRAGKTTLFITAGNTRVAVVVNVYDQPIEPDQEKVVAIALDQTTFNHTYTGTPITGSISILTALYNGSDIKNTLAFSYTSSNTDIVTIDDNGNFNIVGVGNVTITIDIITDGYVGTAYAYIDVEALQSQESIVLNHSSALLNVGETLQLTATGTNKTISWISLTPSVATVSSTGLVTAISQGSTVINASFVRDDGSLMYVSCLVSVKNINPTMLTIIPGNAVINVNENLFITVTSNSAEEVNWLFSDPNLVTVTYNSNNQIKIKALKAGTLTVTAKSGTSSTSAIITIQSSDTYSEYIRSVQQLNAIRYNLSKTFYIAADIDMSGVDWEPIGTSVSPFTGSIQVLTDNNGKYFTLTNLTTINSTHNGLFGYVKNANIENLRISDANINGKIAGVIAGSSSNTKFSNCQVLNSNVNATQKAGGIVGYASSNTIISNCIVSNTNNIKAINGDNVIGSRYVGGITGHAYDTVITGAKVELYAGTISLGSGIYGYVGGIVGFTNNKVSNSVVSASIIANNSYNDFAGGIVGYTTNKIIECTIKNTSITGYYAGGIGGALNVGSNVSLTFAEVKKGYRKQDLSASNYSIDIEKVAVKNTVTVTGNQIGGLFGVITSGVVKNCYTRAILKGNASDSVKGGFASYIKSNGFNDNGGNGQAGIIENCYVACVFEGVGKNYATTSSLVHNYASLGNGDFRDAGYIFNYVFDNDLDGGAEYYQGSNLFVDNVKAKKSTNEMKNSETYTSKGFSTSYWNFNEDYPTLKSEL